MILFLYLVQRLSAADRVDVLYFLRFLLRTLTFSLLLLNFRENYVNCDSQHVFNHPRQVNLQELARFFDARVRVDFNQPYIEVFVKHEIVPK